MKEIGIYIHIPFCIQKCYYCDFCSFDKLQNKQAEYVDALIEEIKNTHNKNEHLIKTFYIGGGTPSILNVNALKQVMEAIKTNFLLSKDCEITVEMNPGTVTKEKLQIYKDSGINRLSIGLQSTTDEILKELGRIHNYKQFEDIYEEARALGFNNINVDLMIGLPNQTIDDVSKSLKDIIQKIPEHISGYSLILEDVTKLKNLIEEENLSLPDEDTERAMYWTVKNTLEKNGYNHYEISNFSKLGYESKHNTDCWNQKEYIGFGIAAHSYFNNIRYSNICDINEYVKNINSKDFEKNVIIHEIQEEQDKMNEYMILGLRMIKGVNEQVFKEKFSKDINDIYIKSIEKLINLELISNEKGIIKLTKKGIDFANIVWEEFV